MRRGRSCGLLEAHTVEGVDLGHPTGVAAFPPWGLEPHRDDLPCEGLADEPGSEGQHVGVVVLPAVAGRRDVVAEGFPPSENLVGGVRAALCYDVSTARNSR